jgi:hypothetical protein
MKRLISGILFVLLTGSFSWGQGTKKPYDIKKLREEQDILCRILNTRLSQFAPNHAYTSNINSFYLAGQGIVLILKTDGFRYLLGSSNPFSTPHWSDEPSGIGMALYKDLVERSQELSRVKDDLSRKTPVQTLLKPGQEAGKDDANAAAPPAVHSPFDKSSVERISNLEKEILELSAKIREHDRETQKVNEQFFLKTLEELRPILIETIVKYGDSLTIVPPEEYISFVLRTDGLYTATPRFDVISARKSWINDYRAGRLTLDALKQKIIQYSD